MSERKSDQQQRQQKPNISPAMLESALKGVSFPAAKDDLLKQAQANHADPQVTQVIRMLPADRFNSPTDVTKAFGQLQ